MKVARTEKRGKFYFWKFNSRSEPAKRASGVDQRVGNGRAGRQREHPGPEDAFDDVQLERVETFRAADAHDGSGDGVGGGDGHPEMRGSEQHARTGGFRREAVNGMELHHFVAERLDDSPAAGGGAGAHGQRAENGDRK